LLDIHQGSDAFEVSNALLPSFPNSVHLLSQLACSFYTAQELDHAATVFRRLLKVDPFRFEQLDLFSNILFIKEDYGELAVLAYQAFKLDKFRPETCCVVANYYSLRGDHKSSALYLMRAVKLDRKFSAAFTLMGHEYLEMKNSGAAIECYRTAID
jgi:anaphase-promoting complex subunit 8